MLIACARFSFLLIIWCNFIMKIKLWTERTFFLRSKNPTLNSLTISFPVCPLLWLIYAWRKLDFIPLAIIHHSNLNISQANHIWWTTFLWNGKNWEENEWRFNKKRNLHATKNDLHQLPAGGATVNYFCAKNAIQRK